MRLMATAAMACSLNLSTAHDMAGLTRLDSLHNIQPSPTNQPKGEPLLKDVVGGRMAAQNYAHMEMQFNTSGQAQIADGKYAGGKFTVNGMKIQVSGQLSDNIGYMFRESFTKQPQKSTADNLSTALEKAYVTWNVARDAKLVIGKQYIEIGGYEYWLSSNRIRFYSDFNATVHCAQTGIGSYMSLSPGHTVALQLLTNSCATNMDTYEYGFPETLRKSKTPVMGIIGYKGYFADRTFALHYGASYGQLATNRQQMMLTAGHVYERGPVLAYLDVMYAREGIDTKGIISGCSEGYHGGNDGVAVGHTAQNVEYLSTIADIDYRLSQQFNVYVKGVYETGRVYRANGIYQAGRYNDTWSLQACVEYFPIRERDLRVFLHGVYKKTNLTQLGQMVGGMPTDMARVSVGIEYVLPVF